MPIPPYLNRVLQEELDRERYQTVYAAESGAVAAPLQDCTLRRSCWTGSGKKEFSWPRLLLHVGLGTFQPIRVERVQDHVIHRERYCIPA